MSAVSGQERWEGRLADGQVITGAELSEWSEATAEPALSGHRLYDSQNPFSSLVDRTAVPREPVSYVEMVGGDRLTGEMVGYRSAAASPYEWAPPHLLVRSLTTYDPPDDVALEVIRVSTRWVRKVVLQSLGQDRYDPGVVWLRGGGQIPFRSLRWTADGVSLLTDGGLRALSLLDIAEIHLPLQDDWEAYCEQVAILTPTLESRLLQIDLEDGTRITTSTERFQPRHWGDRKRQESWLQLVRPAWSLDTMWVQFPKITAWCWFDPTEPPLSWSRPYQATHEAVFGGSWSWQRDRNTLGTSLQLGQQHWPRGFGVHGSTDLTFSLPSFAQALRTHAGLDAAAGTGGSVQLFILGHDGQTQFSSDPLVGSDRVIDTGWVPLTSSSSQESPVVTLRSDMLRDQFPQGADPFDIRDIVGWGDTRVRCDREQLQARLATLTSTAAWSERGWTLSEVDAASIRWRNWLDETNPRSPQFRRLWSTSRPHVVLRRSLKVSAEDRWISLIVSRFEKCSEPTLVQIKVDGRSAGELEIPLRQGPIDPLPITVPLPPGPARSVELELVVYSPGVECWWEWRNVVATAEPPGIRILFDEHAPEWLNANADGGVQLDLEQAYSGQHSLRIPHGRFEFPDAESLTAPMADLPRLGEFRFLTFAWRGAQTPGLVMGLAHEGRFGMEIATGLGLAAPPGRPAVRRGGRIMRLEDRGLKHGFAYDIGSFKVDDVPPLRLDRTVPGEWRFESRDVVQDFGRMDLTGLALECREVGTGWFDALALARTPQDLERVKLMFGARIDVRFDNTYSKLARNREEWGPAIADFAPQFASPQASRGVLQLRVHQGQSDGWQTHPEERDRPFVLRTVHAFSADHPEELDVLVSHFPGSDFRLVVRVDGEQVLDQLIDDKLTTPQRGWASLQVDLSKYQGRTALVEVWNASNDWSNEHAVWKRVRIRPQ